MVKKSAPIQWGAGLHWTSSKRSWFGLFASLRDGRILLRAELTWTQSTPDVAAVDIKALYARHKVAECVVVANPQLWPVEKTRAGFTISEDFRAAGIRMRQGSGDRVNGLARIKRLLVSRPWKVLRDGEIVEERSPALLIHEDCAVIARVFPVVMEDESNPDDMRENPQFYPILGLMYYVMSRPLPTPSARQEMPPDAIGHLVNEVRAALERGE